VRGAKVDPSDTAVRAAVIEALRARAVDGKAPSLNDWRRERPRGLPSAAWIVKHWGWALLAQEAELRLRQERRCIAHPGADIDAPLGDDERHAWLDGIFAEAYMATLPRGLPVCDTPRDLGGARQAWLVK
jgi:hypothetical protein